MDRKSLVSHYKTWMQAQQLEGATASCNEEGVTYTAPWATAHCQIYELEMDVVSMDIIDPTTGENRFFLHFELRDLDRAKQLFAEMAERFSDLSHAKPTQVLLSCTSAMTTGYFAMKLNEAAKAFELNYEFAAVSMDRVYSVGFEKDAVLLAPQAAYIYDKLAGFLDDRTVRVIPAKLFGSYDVMGVLDFVRTALTEDRAREAKRVAARAVERIRNEMRVLVLTTLPGDAQTSIVCRIYQNGEPLWEQVVIKKHLDLLADISDILATASLSARMYYDVVGIALPGIIDNGCVYSDSDEGTVLTPILEDRFGVPVVATNEVNAAALGYYLQQDRFKDVLLVSMPQDGAPAGQGMVLDGKLRLGAHHMAGETSFLPHDLAASDETEAAEWDDNETAVRFVARAVQNAIATIDPEVACVHCDAAPDTDAIRDELARHVPERYLPQLVHVSTADMHEFAMLGQMAIAIAVLEGRKSASKD